MARVKTAEVDLSIARLRSLVDYRPYSPSSAAPTWLSRLSKASASGLSTLTVLAPHGVSIRQAGRRIRPALDPAAVQLLGLVEAVTRRRLGVGIGLPPDAPHLPLLLAAAEVLAETVSNQREKSTRRGVLLVSPDLELRSRYPDLSVRNIDLDAAHPGSRMRPDGVRLPLKGLTVPVEGGVCFYLPMLSLPARIDFHPALIIVDLRYGRLARRATDLAAWATSIGNGAGVICLYTCGDEETSAALAAAHMPLFPFDHRAVATADDLATGWTRHAESPIDWDLKEAPEYLQRRHRVIEVPLDTEMLGRFDGLQELLSKYGTRDSPDLRRARWLLATLRQIPAPLKWYEDCAVSLGRSTLHRMIQHLGARSNRDPSDLGPVIQTLRVHFDDLYAALDEDNPRANALLSLHVEGCRFSSAPTFVFRDVVFRRSFEMWTSVEALPSQDITTPVAAVAFADIATHQFTTDAAVFNGPVRPRYRWILGAHLPEDVIFVCYRPEIGAIESQLGSLYGAPDNDRRQAARESFMGKVLTSSDTGTATSVSEVPIPHLILDLPTVAAEPQIVVTKPRMQTVPGGLAGLKDFLKRVGEEQQEAPPLLVPLIWDDDSADELELTDDLDGSDGIASPDDIDCVTFEVSTRFAGHCRLHLPADAPVDLMRPFESDELRRIPATKVRPDDVLLRIEDGRRASLFDRIVEIAERHPGLATLSVYRMRWREACQRLAGRFASAGAVDYRLMLQELRLRGATIQSEQAAMWWVRELVIGPETAASISAVGKVIGDDSLVQEARSFDSAFRKIRGLRSGIGRRLSGAIRKTFHQHMAVPSPHQSSDDGGDIGLPFEELAETIDIAQVTAVMGRQKVAPYLVDRLLRG